MTATMIEAAVRALLFALAVGAGLSLFRVRNVPVRKTAWSLVLVASVAMPFLMRAPAVAGWKAQWGWAVPLPEQPTGVPVQLANAARVEAGQANAVPADATDEGSAARTSRAVPIAAVATVDLGPAVTDPLPASRSARWGWPPAGRLAAMIYLGVAGVLLLRLLWGLAMAVRLWATADRVSPLVAPEPNVRSSAKISSPVTIGSGIVLPADYEEWDRRKLRMVLAHERSHVRQMDFYLQLLAGLYTAAFWFSPLGWWLRRTLASLGEAIGDRAGLDAAASRSGYAEVLLEFAALPRQSLPGVAMARPGNLSHRVERLLNESLFQRAFAEGKRRALLSLALVPVALFAATILIRVPGAAAQTAPAAPTPPSPAAAPGTAPAPAAMPGVPAAQAPVAPETPGATVTAPGGPVTAPAAPAAAPRPPDTPAVELDHSPDTMVEPDDDLDVRGGTYTISDDGDSYAIVEGPGRDITFSGSWNSVRKAEIDAARKVAKGPFLWFSHGGKSYIVTDPAVMARVRALYKPMEGLGQQQAALGKQQEELGKQMEELAREQRAAGQVKMPDLSKEMAELDQAMAKFKADRSRVDTRQIAEAEAKLRAAQDQMLTPERMGDLQSELAAAQADWNSEKMADLQERLGELQSRLGELQGEAGEREGEFGAKMGALGAEQGRLGAQQGRLGAEQGRLGREADRQMRGILDDCLRNGKAATLPQ
jgi:hypothetical protein